MIRTVKDFNKEYLYRCWLEETKNAGRSTKGAAVKNILFYSALAVMVLLAFFYSGNRQPGKRFGPFAYNVVLTTSMNSVYPQGSLITSWAVKQNEPLEAGLANGTDIVFIKDDEGTVVVHRIIEIMEDYENSGQRAFRTQGVDNPSPDTWITYEGNVVGRVTGHVPYLGAVMMLVAENIFYVVGGIAVLAVLFALWKAALKKES
jgi:signal peptidase I